MGVGLRPPSALEGAQRSCDDGLLARSLERHTEMTLSRAVRPAFLAGLLLAFVAGCEIPVEPPVFAELTFTERPPIRLDVARVETVEKYASPLQAPNVEHMFPVRPAAAARRWVEDRLSPVGAVGMARVTIENASVVEVPLETRGGLIGIFWNDQASRYDAELVLRVEILSEGGVPEGFARAVTRRSTTVAENITLSERDAVFYDLTKALLDDLDGELESAIRRYLRPFVR